MTNVVIRRVPIMAHRQTDGENELQVIVQGHANYAGAGQDIVCAAESILVHSFAAVLAGLTQDYLSDFSVEGEDGSGCVAITAVPTKRGWRFVCGAFETIAMGFFLLAKAYPKHVAIHLNPKQEEE